MIKFEWDTAKSVFFDEFAVQFLDQNNTDTEASIFDAWNEQ